MQDIEEVVEESEETAAPEEVKEPDYRGFANSAEGLSLYKTVIAYFLYGGMDSLHTPFESHCENHKVSSLFGICR